ncbi:MAG: ATP-binding protein [Candidatus Symbiothrix sp.]|jgi:AAA+ ATPase superfamily predicted ATPase|nr:ATP-binding protein [Candidatus Symbiothrix sp.]
MQIIGRNEQKELLSAFVASDKPEFVIVYGRRRVGKTFLIKEFFCNNFAFYHTGLANCNIKKQLQNFSQSLNLYGKMPYPKINNWFDAFAQLRHLLENDKSEQKQVVFLDEVPWLDTHRSDFVSALEYFWNSWASSQPQILLIICGSATSWIINKIVKNHGGLHNRITQQLFIEPFTLSECELFFKENNIEAERHQIVEYYMILGGIPYYLNLIKKQYSIAQNIDLLFFKENATLKNEFSNLYASLFKNSDNYIKIVETLSKKTKGLTRNEIIENAGLLNGGGTTKMLEELEQCGFIRKYHDFGKKNRESIFQLVDFFTLFYFNFIHNSKTNDEHYWSNLIDNAKHRAWSGYAFELLCLSHIEPIKQKLGISGVLANVSEWRSKNAENGVQIDLLIDRNDKVINLCEMKYYNDVFAIDKKMDADLRHKKQVFKDETKTRKAVHITVISTYGLKHNAYWGNIQSEVTINDLFFTPI